jgi:hypothetical protein
MTVTKKMNGYRNATFIELYDAHIFINLAGMKGITNPFVPAPTSEVQGKDVRRFLDYLSVPYESILKENDDDDSAGVMAYDSFPIYRCMNPYMEEHADNILIQIEARADFPQRLSLRLRIQNGRGIFVRSHTYCGSYAVTWEDVYESA